MRRTIGRAIVALLSAALLSTPGAAVAAASDPVVTAGVPTGAAVLGPANVLASLESDVPVDDEPPFVTGTPSISGSAIAGQTLTAEPGAWSEGTTFTYRWLAGGAVIGEGQILVLSDAQIGASVSVEVTGSHPGSQEVTVRSPAVLVAARPLVSAKPTISGTAIVGNTLTAATGAWTTGTTFTYQWLADGVVIANATARTFRLTTAQSGKAITVRVTGSRPSWATVARTSKATPRVMRWSTPTMSGTFAYGSTLTAKPGTWTTGATYRYQWYSDGRAITGATYSTLKLGTAQKDKRISVKVTGSKSAHPTVAKTSAQSGKIAVASTPKISGTPIHGTTLTAKPGTWTAYTKFSYQWYADGAPISGATYSTLKLGTGQKGKRITVKVTGKRTGYATVVKTSAATLRVATVSTPTIGGSRLVTYTLTARPGTWTTGTAFTYQWYANGVAISGATYATLKLKAGQVGKRITVKVTGTKTGHPKASRTSAATGAIAYPVRTSPVSSWNCPSWAQIKGNANSMIYHLPSGRYYKATKPEECFRTERAAVNAGYRKSKL
jgi:hypothetical protein